MVAHKIACQTRYTFSVYAGYASKKGTRVIQRTGQLPSAAWWRTHM